jgi:chromatin segregation and condensation protein Rec8/ScpA/Scc1 (kleisin family)
MSFQGKKVVGVWMDYQRAVIISSDSRKVGGAFEVQKQIARGDHDGEEFKNESQDLKKETAELKKYFKAIADEIDQDDCIYIFGPGKSQEEFKNILEDNHVFRSKEIKLGSSDKISHKQMVDKVEAYFGA